MCVCVCLLQNYSLSCVSAHSYSFTLMQAVSICLIEKFDLIFMDCHMPVMDGYTATSQIKSTPESLNCNTPIIALTADVEEGNEKRCIDVGMIGM